MSYVNFLLNQNNSNAQFYYGLIMYSMGIISSAVKYFQQAAQQNHPKAILYLGYIYFEGEIQNAKKKDVQKGIEYYILASQLNESKALYQLGYIYYNGINIPKDTKKGIQYFTLAAKLNEPKSLFQLGIILLENANSNFYEALNYLFRAEMQTVDLEIKIRAKYHLGVFYYKMNKIEKAIHYLSKIVDSNISSVYIQLAQTTLGLIYHESYINDMNKAIHYYQLGADNNNPYAQLTIGSFYLDGIYLKKNINKAIHYLTLSAKKNNVIAQFKLGHIYLVGKLVPQYIEKGFYYISLAAEQNYPTALFVLGFIYYRGTCNKIGINKNIQKGIEYFHKAAQLNDQNALYQLGYMNHYGEEVPININKAIYYYQLAAQKDEPDANIVLGIMYSEGIYVKKDCIKAINFYLIAAHQSVDINASAKAKYYLGLLYFKTKCNLHDINKSIHYLTESSKCNFPDAQILLGKIYYEGIEIPRDINIAIHYFIEASNFKVVGARNYLGVIYKTGDGVEKNIDRSLIYFKESIEKERDYVAFFNFVHITFFDKKKEFNYDESIDLLFQATDKNILYSKELLCLVIVDKYESVTLDIIENDISKIQSKEIKEKYKYISFDIYNTIKLYHIETPYDFLRIYDELKNINLIRTHQFGLISFHMLNTLKKMKDKYTSQNLTKNINKSFYEGLGDVFNS